jgi:hypothetical protein
MKTFNQCLLLALLIIFSSCEPNALESQMIEAEVSLEDIKGLSIPGFFNFATERTVALIITDCTPFVKYEFFGYSSQFGNQAENISDALSNMIYSGRSSNVSNGQVFSLSNTYNKVYISRKDDLEYSFKIKDITINITHFTSPFSTRSSNKPCCLNESSVSG